MTAGRETTSKNKHWGTPIDIVNAVKKTFDGSIALDPCSNIFSIVGAEVEYVLPKNNGLVDSWDYPTIYVNPPYGRDPVSRTSIKNWFEKMSHAANKGSQVIALVPVATNTRHWKDYVFPVADSICFLYEPRVKFRISGEDNPKGAPMACAVIYYGSQIEKFQNAFSSHGAILSLDNVKLPKVT